MIEFFPIAAYGPRNRRRRRQRITITPADPGYLALTFQQLSNYTKVKTAKFFDQKGQNRKVDLAGMQLNLDSSGSIRVGINI